MFDVISFNLKFRLTGQQPVRYYICAGIKPQLHLQDKAHYSKLFIRVLSIFIHLIFGIRIWIFKIKEKKIVRPGEQPIYIRRTKCSSAALKNMAVLASLLLHMTNKAKLTLPNLI